MKKMILMFSILLLSCFLYSQDAVDIGSLQTYKILPLQKNEKLQYEQIGTKNGFELEIYGINKNEEKRILGKIQNFSGYIDYCENGLLYFSVDNYQKWEKDNKSYDIIFELNPKNGVLTKILEGMAFSVSTDGKYICYNEPWQIRKSEKHEVAYRYIYNTKKKSQKLIINEKPKNGYQISGPDFDKDSKQFVFSLGYDADVFEYLYFNPYEMKW